MEGVGERAEEWEQDGRGKPNGSVGLKTFFVPGNSKHRGRPGEQQGLRETRNPIPRGH